MLDETTRTILESANGDKDVLLEESLTDTLSDMANYCIMTIMEIQKDSEYIEGAKPRLDIEIQKEIPKGENKMNYRMVTVNNHHMKLTEEQFKLFQLLFSEELLVQPAIVEVYNENDFRTVDEIIKNGGNEE